MKQVSITKQKVLLTAALLSVLAGNYAFQTSSISLQKNSGSFDMSSNEMETQNDAYLKSVKETAAEVALQKREDDRDKEITRILGLKAEAKKTQAASVEVGACTSGDCKTTAAPSVLLKLEDYNKLLARIDELEKKKAADAVEAKKEEVTKTETRQEKRDRIAQEKKDKEKDKQDERVTKFEDKMQDVQDKCDKDLQCLATEFTAALGKFDGKNAIPAAYVNKYYKSLIGGQLAKSLFTDGADSQASLEVLQTMMTDIPERYRGIKEITMDSVRYQAMAPANRISQGFKNATELSKQNNPQAYFQQLNQTQADQQALTAQANTYSAVIEQSLRENGDNSSIGYYQRSYLPNMQKIMSSLNSPTGVTQTTTVQPTDSTRNGRLAPSTQQPQQQQNQPAQSTRSGNVQQGTQWNLSTDNSGVQMGQPTSAPTTRARGRY